MDSNPKWDLVAAAGTGALGLAAVVRAQMGFGFAFGAAGGVRAETLPTVYGSILLGLSLLLAATAFRKIRQGGSGGEAPFSSELPWSRITGTVAFLIVYVVLLPHVWFLPLTTAFLAGLFVLYGQADVKRVGLVSFVGALALDALFLRVLNLPL